MPPGRPPCFGGAGPRRAKRTTQEKYVYILDNDKKMDSGGVVHPTGGTQDFLMYSNYGSWKLVPTYEEDLEWLSYWPTGGCRRRPFSSAMVEKNTTAYQRHGTLNIVVDGLSVATIRFNQAGDEPKLKVNVKESGKTVSVKGETFTVGVESNIDWVAELVDPADASWVTIGDFTPVSQTFTCAANPARSRVKRRCVSGLTALRCRVFRHHAGRPVERLRGGRKDHGRRPCWRWARVRSRATSMSRAA